MSEELPPLPSDVAGLLKRLPRPVPPPGFEAQVWSRVAATTATGATLGVKAVTLASSMLIIGVGLGVIIDRAFFAPPPPPPEVREVIKEVIKEVRVEVPVVTPVAPVEPAKPKPTPAASPDRLLAEERAVIEMARSALARREPALALTHLENHGARFPSGQLAEEREALWVSALVAAGRKPEAKARAAAFSLRFPQSLLGPSVAEAAK
jgi:hypothetical protein